MVLRDRPVAEAATPERTPCDRTLRRSCRRVPTTGCAAFGEPAMSGRRNILLLHNGEADTATIIGELRAAGFGVDLQRFHEEPSDALLRVSPVLVLIRFGPTASVDQDLQRALARQGCAALLLGAPAESATPCAIHTNIGLPYPLAAWNGEIGALIEAIAEYLQPTR